MRPGSPGARVREGDGYVVMADPEGHRFCLADAPE